VAAAAETIPRLHSRVTLQGDPAGGRVDVICMLHLSQRHMQEDFAHPYVRGLAESRGPWRLIEQKRPDIILIEGFASHRQYPEPSERNRALLLKVFPEGTAPQAGKLTDDQVDILALFPSAIAVYRLHHPHVQVLGADSDSALSVLAGHDGDYLPELRYAYRERLFMSAAVRATADHPGKEVVLIIGAAHRLDRTDAPRGERVPTLITSAFRLILWEPAMMTAMTVRLSRDPSCGKSPQRAMHRHRGVCATAREPQIYAIEHEQFLSWAGRIEKEPSVAAERSRAER
jgi:hypothetical protein